MRGVIVAVAVGAVILGGIWSIARVTSRVGPFMAWAYYGSKAIGYLFGGSRIAETVFKLGNILGLCLLAPVVKRELRGYRAKLSSGAIQPTAARFRRDRPPALTK